MSKSSANRKPLRQAAFMGLEMLEGRQLLSAAPPMMGGFAGMGPQGGMPQGPMGPGLGGATIEFSQAPTAVQSGLDALAKKDNLSDPADTQKVVLGNSNGVETYSVTIDGTGSVTMLTVDQDGDAVSAPTHTTTTWATLNGTGDGSNSAAAAEITAIATALDLTAPSDTDTIDVTTIASGTTLYSIHLSPASSSSTTNATDDSTTNSPDNSPQQGPPGPGGPGGAMGKGDGILITVDSNGNPAGNEDLPFSVIPGVIQKGLNKNAPTGATALASNSAQTVNVHTVDGVTMYSVTYTVSGTPTVVTVDATGAPIDLPKPTTTDFSTIPSAAQTELQTLATADGVSGTINDTQSVDVFTEINGTVIYSVTLDPTSSDTTDSFPQTITITVDAAGNPTTIPNDQGPGGFGGVGGFNQNTNPPPTGTGDSAPGPGMGPDKGSGSTDDSGPPSSTPPDSDSSGSSSSGDSSSTAASTSTAASVVSVANGGGVGAALGGFGGFSKVSFNAYAGTGKFIGTADPTLTRLMAASLGIFSPNQADAAVVADLKKLKADGTTLNGDIHDLSKASRLVYRTDERAITKAIAALKTTLKPLEKTLASDSAKWHKTLATDERAIHKDKSDATKLATDKSTLASDEAAAFTAIFSDQKTIQSAIDGDSTVASAKAKLATDLPTIAGDQTTVQTDFTQLQNDIKAQLDATAG
jgi:hypothetical protein